MCNFLDSAGDRPSVYVAIEYGHEDADPFERTHVEHFGFGIINDLHYASVGR